MNFDSQILDHMIGYGSWSDPFLKESSALIQKIKNINYVSQLTSYQRNHLLPIPEDLLLTSMHQLFDDIKYQEYILHYLKPYQYGIMQDVHDHQLIRSLDDFHYFMSHIPFHSELSTLLCDHVRNKIKGVYPDIYQKFIQSFVSPVIQSWIFMHGHYVSTYQFILNKNFVVHLQIIHEEKESMTKIAKSICQIIMVVRMLYHVTDVNPLKIIYALTPFKKRLDYFTKDININQYLINQLRRYKSIEYNYRFFTNPISNLNVNTGVTVSGVESYIGIWRTEESSKVLIHELIHYYRLENGLPFDVIKVNISNNFPHYSKELFTELQTWYLYTMYQLSRLAYRFTLDQIVFMLDYERTHTFLNMVRIFQHYQITNLDQFLTNDKNHLINVNTSVLYYYLLKAIALFQINPLIEEIIFPSYKRHNLTKELEQYLKKILHSMNLKTYVNHLLHTTTKLNDHIPMMSLHLLS